MKKGDSPNREVTPGAFRNAVLEAGVAIVGITNHNQFDVEQFGELQRSVGDTVQLWPGIELDVKSSREGSHWHMLVLCGPSNLCPFDATIRSLIGGVSPNELMLHIRDVFEAFGDQNVIYISHCHDKKPYLSESDIEEMEGLVSQSWRLFYEPKKLVTVGIWANHGRNMILGSDVQEWSNYPGGELPSLRLPVDSFEQFCLLAQRDEGTIETLLGRKGMIGVIAHPNVGIDVPLTLREDINVLFGQKGTGKTKIVESIERELVSRGLRCCSYYGSKKHEGFGGLLATDSVKRDPELFGRASGSDEISSILTWEDATITPLSDYVEWWQTRPNSEGKAKFKLSEADEIVPEFNPTFSSDLAAKSAVERFATKLRENYAKYLEVADYQELQRLLDLLQVSALKAARRSFVEHRSAELTNRALKVIKSSIEAKSDTKTKPGSTGFVSFARGRLQLRATADAICHMISPATKCEKEHLGTLEDKGELLLATRFRYLDSDSKSKSTTDEFDDGIRDLRAWKRALIALRDCALTSRANAAFDSFKKVNADFPVTNLSSFIGVKRYVTLSSSDSPYEPSNGEEGILLLERTLDRDADVYLLDEVELGMSNSYVDAVIRDKVQRLARRGKTLVIATHNANLAVRTLPYVTVYREHIDGDRYATYVGNPFVDSLVDIHGVRSALSWADKSMEVLEGGTDAFYNRQEIYEAGKR